MKIAIGCDHGGIVLKDAVTSTLEALGAEVVDLGTNSTDSVDYPTYGLKVAETVASGQCDAGVIMCGTGIGISISANKVPGIRCAVVTNTYMAKLTKNHNNANIICLGERVTGQGIAADMVDIFLSTPFEGGRHLRRINLFDK